MYMAYNNLYVQKKKHHLVKSTDYWNLWDKKKKISVWISSIQNQNVAVDHVIIKQRRRFKCKNMNVFQQTKSWSCGWTKSKVETTSCPRRPSATGSLYSRNKMNCVCTYHIPLKNKLFRYPWNALISPTISLHHDYSTAAVYLWIPNLNAHHLVPKYRRQKSFPSHAWVRVHAVDEIVNLAVVLPVVTLVGLLDKHEHRDQKQERSTDEHGEQKGRTSQLPAQSTSQYF